MSTLVNKLLGSFTLVLILFTIKTNEIELECKDLIMGQFICPDPNIIHIDPKTQQPIGCTKENKAKVWCIAAPGITCSDTKNSSFLGEIPCQWT